MAPIAHGLILAALTAFTALASSSDVPGGIVTGGWSSKPVTPALTNLLAEAMTANGDAGYASAVGQTRVCFAKVRSVESQVVAGTNYRFHVSGCAVSGVKSAGTCSNKAKKGCRANNFAVQVFEQVWSDTLQVTSISTET